MENAKKTPSNDIIIPKLECPVCAHEMHDPSYCDYCADWIL